MVEEEPSKPDSLWLRLLLRLMQPPADDREPLWAISRKWLPFTMGMIAVLTFGWTWVIYREVVASAEHRGISQTAIALVREMSPAAALILLYSLSITYVLDTIGGLLMVTARYLGNKFVTPLIEKHKAEGRTEGIAEGLAEGEARRQLIWEDWNRRRLEAEENDLPFDEPPPCP